MGPVRRAGDLAFQKTLHVFTFGLRPVLVLRFLLLTPPYLASFWPVCVGFDVNKDGGNLGIKLGCGGLNRLAETNPGRHIGHLEPPLVCRPPMTISVGRLLLQGPLRITTPSLHSSVCS